MATKKPAPVDCAVTGDAEADALLVTDPLALLIGMLLDQQVPMEWAFRGPLKLKERLGGKLDAGAIAAMPVDDLVAVFAAKPALHRFPGAMAKRTHALCTHLVEQYDGDAANVWKGADDRRRAASSGSRACPASAPRRRRSSWRSWRSASGCSRRAGRRRRRPFSDSTPRSVADIDSPESLARVREWKRAQKALGKTKAD